ncbi:MAG TPA: hypothetical protein VHM19_06860, partial [Polyangiales bacterium]|nr:hypothetical protein [Polyangiales bacterium]
MRSFPPKLALAVLLVGSANVRIVRAQAESSGAASVIVVASDHTPAALMNAAARVHGTLSTHGKLQLMSDDVAATRLVERGYAPHTQAADAAFVGDLTRRADELLQAVAFGRDDETVTSGELLLSAKRETLQAAARSDAGAKAIADGCLYMVRALIHRGDSGRARERVRECLRLSPDLLASADVHPPEVRALVDAMRSDDRALAHVHVSFSGEAAGCSLRVNGRPAAALPTTLALVPGSYALQASCGRDGLVHRLDLRSGADVTVAIDPSFEQALQLDASGLHYLAPRNETSTQRTGRLAAVAQWLGAGTLWTIEVDAAAPSSLRIVRWRVQGATLARIADAPVELQPTGTFGARSEAAVGALACAPRCRAAQPSKPLGAGELTVIAAGGAAVAASWVLWARYAALDSKLDSRTHDQPSYASTLDTRDTFGTAALISSGAGTLVLATSAALWLPRRDSVPWWAWLSGAAGLGVASAGVVSWLGNGDNVAAQCPSG